MSDISDDELYEKVISCHTREHPAQRNPERPGKFADLNSQTFEELARQVMSSHYGISLNPQIVPPTLKKFDLVSDDFTIVGDAKFYKMVRGKNLPPAKFSAIAEYVWLLEKIKANKRFIVFGQDRRVPEEWLKRHAHLVENVAFFFLDDSGVLHKLT
jgi:hypothetical protein